MFAEPLPAAGGGTLSERYRTDICRPSLGAISRAVAAIEVSIAQAETPWLKRKYRAGSGLIGSSAFRRKRESRDRSVVYGFGRRGQRRPIGLSVWKGLAT